VPTLTAGVLVEVTYKADRPGFLRVYLNKIYGIESDGYASVLFTAGVTVLSTYKHCIILSYIKDLGFLF
jgi:hypothetical protein